MFTGLVEEIGILRSIARQGESMVLSVSAAKIMDDVHIGDSIAVNGVCLTVVSFDRNSVTMDVMPETYRHTNLGRLKPGSRVNLERAMPANGRFGGHLVQGHVDCTGTITERYPEQNAVVFRVSPSDSSILKYVVPQGSITLDGISLTVVSTTSDSFVVSIIPHTLAETILQDKHPGDTVNIECDILGKYIDHLLRCYAESDDRKNSRRPGGMSLQFLAEHGFLD
jgi:riboflavin synthase